MNKLTYVILMALTTNFIRILPLTLVRGEIKNKFLKSFLYYVPYVTLSVMTFPAIIEATNSPLAGWAALLIGIAAAYFGLGLFPVSIICCLSVFILEML